MSHPLPQKPLICPLPESRVQQDLGFSRVSGPGGFGFQGGRFRAKREQLEKGFNTFVLKMAEAQVRQDLASTGLFVASWLDSGLI